MKNVNEQGRSMIEMLGVLAIIGVLSVGGFSLVNKMHNSYEVNQVIDITGELASRTRTVVRNYDDSDDEDDSKKNTSMEAFLRKAKAIPDIFLDADSFEFGDVKFTVQYLGDQIVTFAVKAENLTEEMCMEMVTINWGGPGSSGFLGMSIGGGFDDVSKAIDGKTGGSDTVAIVGSSTHPAPMGIGAATENCSDGASVVLSFR